MVLTHLSPADLRQLCAEGLPLARLILQPVHPWPEPADLGLPEEDQHLVHLHPRQAEQHRVARRLVRLDDRAGGQCAHLRRPGVRAGADLLRPDQLVLPAAARFAVRPRVRRRQSRPGGAEAGNSGIAL